MKQKKRTKQLAFLICITLILPMWMLPETDASAAASFEEVTAAVWDQAYADFEWEETGLTPWNGGKEIPSAGMTEKIENVYGDEMDAYPVYTPEEFRYCMEQKANFKLMNDIDLGGAEGREWEAVTNVYGNMEHWVIDGNNYTVYNLDIAAVRHQGYGLLRVAYQGGNDLFFMKNLTFKKAQNVQLDATLFDIGLSILGGIDTGTVVNVGVEDALVYGMQNCSGFTGSTDYFDYYMMKLDNCYTKGVTVVTTTSGGANFIVGGNDREITNCYAIGGAVISGLNKNNPNSMYAGGFASSITGKTIIENCFTNVDVYSRNETGAFLGVVFDTDYTSTLKLKIKNCYASGKVQGTNRLSGFLGGVRKAKTGLVEEMISIENCYSTAGVGLSEMAEQLAGFHGGLLAGASSYNKYIKYKNCYMAGEVGAENTSTSSGNVYAVSGTTTSDTENYENMYYDKQTTGMKERGTAVPTVGIDGLLTKDLMNTYIDGKTETTSEWELAEGVYPQLKVFTNPDSFIREESRYLAKAYSKASVSTAILYPSYLEEEKYEEVKTENSADYDTVRSIRYSFPLTNNTIIGNSAQEFDIIWQTDGAKSPIDELADIDVITLSDYPDYKVIGTAPGVSTLSVETALTDELGNVLEVGRRSQRLIPRNAFVIDELNKTIYHVRDETARNNLDEKYRRFRARTSILFAFIDENKTIQNGNVDVLTIPEAELKYENDSLLIDREILESGGISGEVKIQIYDEEGNQLAIDEKMYELLNGERDPDLEEAGIYIIKYQWYLDGFESGTGVVERSQTLHIKIAPEITYHYKEGEGSKTTLVTYVDHGPYLEGEAAADPGLDPEVEDETGYEFVGWAETNDPSTIDPDTFTDWYDPSAADNYLDGDKIIWAIYSGEGAGTIELEVSEEVHYGIQGNPDGTGGNPIPVKETKYSIENMVLKVEDLRNVKEEWKLSAKLEEGHLTNGGEVLEGALVYHNGTTEAVLKTDQETLIWQDENTADIYDIFGEWYQAPGNECGLYVKVNPGDLKLGTYTAKIRWILSDAP